MRVSETPVILASRSPRRQQLLRQIGISSFDVRPADIDESAVKAGSPSELVEILSRKKAEAIESEDALVISADTVVSLDGEVLGKPESEEDARRMLESLSGKSHFVYTGVTVRWGQHSRTGVEKTEVFFRKLTPSEIRFYIETREPMDKAGAYGIQERGALFVEKIIGDYYNVMGLPLCHLEKLLKSLNFEL